MKFALNFLSRQKLRQSTLEEAVKPVVEPLEQRLMLSTHRHTSTLIPSEVITGGRIRGSAAAPSGENLTQIKHLYGLDALSTPSSVAPLFTGTGLDQFAVVIGSYDPNYNDIPKMRKSNINLWSKAEGVGSTAILEDPITYGGQDPTVATDPISQEETTAVIEWVHGMAPGANIAVVEVPITKGVVSPAVLSLAIQESVRLCQEHGRAGPIGNHLPGGVVVMALNSRGEDATLSAQYDALFNYKSARSVSFVAPTGEYGGNLSMPATSPWVTAVGTSFVQTDTAGNRVFEIADPNSGGALSGVQPVPAFQAGLSVGGKRLRTRAVPDLVMAGHPLTPTAGPGGIGGGQIGLDVFYDPTADASATNPWDTIQGTQIAAAEFAGAVAVVNELREYSSLGPIGRDLNNELYAAYHNNPASFNDIVQGNNTLFQATRGYDLATGLGTPNFQTLIPLLGGVSTVAAPLTFTGNEFFSFKNTGPVQSSVLAFRGTGTADIGPQFVHLTLTATGSSTLTQSGTSTTITYTATLNAPLITRALNNSISGFGTVTVIGGTSNETFQVAITGRVSKTRRGSSVTGSIYSIDANGKRLPFGSNDIFQGTFSA